MNISIYEDKHRKEVQSICMDSFEGASSLASAIQTVFCDSYLDLTPNTCLVLQDEKECVFGYVLSASSYEKWRDDQADYLQKAAENPIAGEMAKGVNEAMADYAKKYPAHFHIQIKEEARGKGYGSMLLRCLEERMRTMGVNAIMCNVASDNEKAQAFYLKNGYTELGGNQHELAMGKVLSLRKRR